MLDSSRNSLESDDLSSSRSHDIPQHSRHGTPLSDGTHSNNNILSDHGSAIESVTTGSADELDNAMEDILRNYHPSKVTCDQLPSFLRTMLKDLFI